jgi:plasmid stabilization system protein ParE
MADYFITDPAAADIENLWNGLIERGATVDSADRFVLELFQTFQNLADFPDIGTPRPYLPAGDLAFPHRQHMIFYYKRQGGVDIDHVLYGGMDLESYFSEVEH